MTRSTILLVACSAVMGLANSAIAQLPLPTPPTSGNTLQRLPNDQIEGTIFEYKGTFKASATATAEPEVLEGKFRLEGSAIFDVGGSFRAPSQAELEKIKNKILSGKGGEIKLPGPPQQKRLGQYQKTYSDRLRLEFDDKDSLFGTMLINRKKGTDDVWIGTFAERQGAKLIRTWQVQVRPIED